MFSARTRCFWTLFMGVLYNLNVYKGNNINSSNIKYNLRFD